MINMISLFEYVLTTVMKLQCESSFISALKQPTFIESDINQLYQAHHKKTQQHENTATGQHKIKTKM